jgi:hypothetical protein
LLGNLYHHYSLPENSSAGMLILINIVGASIFCLKALGLIFVQMWLRWTLPRPRIDQVLYACVKVLLPLACVLLLGAALWQWLVPERPGIPWRDYNPWNFAEWFRAGFGAAAVTQIVLTLIGLSGFTAIVAWVLYAAASGRNLKQRLTDPAPIDEPAEQAAVTA